MNSKPKFDKNYTCQIKVFLGGAFDKKCPTLIVASFFLFFVRPQNSLYMHNLPRFGVDIKQLSGNQAVAGSSPCFSQQLFFRAFKGTLLCENIVYTNFWRYIRTVFRFSEKADDFKKTLFVRARYFRTFDVISEGNCILLWHEMAKRTILLKWTVNYLPLL